MNHADRQAPSLAVDVTQKVNSMVFLESCVFFVFRFTDLLLVYYGFRFCGFYVIPVCLNVWVCVFYGFSFSPFFLGASYMPKGFISLP